jgi:hypothetical protein
MRRWANIVGTALLAVAAANFLAFAIVALILGGDALSGKAEGDHYYLRHKRRYTEVSREVWMYSRIHAISVCITQPVGIFVGGGALTWARRRSRQGLPLVDCPP